MSDAAKNEAAPKKRGGMLILVIIAANVVLGGGAAAFFLLRGSGGDSGGGGGGHGAPSSGGHGSSAEGEHGAATHAAKSGAPIVAFPPVVVNLNEPEGTRYLKTTISIQLSERRFESQIEQLRPAITDAFIRELSELNFRQTMGAKNKTVIKRRLLKRFNEALGSEAGVDVLFTEFVVQ